MNWTTKDGVEIPISQMTTSHIENCINAMERNGSKYVVFGGTDEDGRPWADQDINPFYEALVEEMEARKK
jgi:hypothetical protein